MIQRRARDSAECRRDSSLATYQQMVDKPVDALACVHQNTGGTRTDEVAICSLQGVLWDQALKNARATTNHRSEIGNYEVCTGGKRYADSHVPLDPHIHISITFLMSDARDRVLPLSCMCGFGYFGRIIDATETSQGDM